MTRSESSILTSNYVSTTAANAQAASSSISGSVSDTMPAAASSATTAAASTPLKRLAYASTTTCAAQASTYGNCILATYTDVRKDACKAEFEHFGACLRKAVRVWLEWLYAFFRVWDDES